MRTIVEERLALVPQSRPFVCNGIPKEYSVFLVGYNPASRMSTPWSDYWTDKGFEFEEWEAYYLQSRGGRPSQTRRRINLLRFQLQDTRWKEIVETNLWDFPTPSARHLQNEKKGQSQLFRLVAALRPRFMIIHGARTRTEFFSVMKKFPDFRLNRDILAYPSGATKLLFCGHFSRVSYDSVRVIAREILSNNDYTDRTVEVDAQAKSSNQFGDVSGKGEILR